MTETEEARVVDVDLGLTAEDEPACDGAYAPCPKVAVRAIAADCGCEKTYCIGCFDEVWRLVNDWLRQFGLVSCRICHGAIFKITERPIR